MSLTATVVGGLTRRARALCTINSIYNGSSVLPQQPLRPTAMVVPPLPSSPLSLIVKRYSVAQREVGDIYGNLDEDSYNSLRLQKKTYLFVGKSTPDGRQKILKLVEKSNSRASNLFIGSATTQALVDTLREFAKMDLPENYSEEEKEFNNPSEFPKDDPTTAYVEDSYNPTRYFRIRLRKSGAGKYVDITQKHFPGYVSPYGRGSKILIDVEDLPSFVNM